MRSDMKRLSLGLLIALAPLCAFAQRADISTLRAYATKAMPRCPGSVITLDQLPNAGPAGFIPYDLTQTSTDKYCGSKKTLLYSPSSQQILVATVFPLAMDARPAGDRISEVVMQALKQPVKVTIAPFPLPDGLHAVSMARETPYGPFAYHGFLDQSQAWMMVGFRGSLRTEPSQSLLDSINLSSAVRRGNPKSKVKIVELSDFECPTCGRAHKKIEPIIAKNLSKVDYYRLDLPLFETHPWAMDAALGARAISRVAPAKYWDYDNWIYANQEEIDKAHAAGQPFEKILKDWCDDHDVNYAAVDKIVKSPAERTALLEQVSRLFDIGVNSTPTYIINGAVMGFGPEGQYTIDAINSALGIKEAPAKTNAAKKPKKTG
jgi:protein-disulfide isomerase